MKCIKQLTSTALLSVSMMSNSGVVTPTAHSRANCAGFNESITWQLGHSYWWRVESHHFLSIRDVRPHHILNTGKKQNMVSRGLSCHGRLL